MNSNSALAEVKPISQFAKLKAKLKGIEEGRRFGGSKRYGPFKREQIEALKLALVPHLLTLCGRFFPSGRLSLTGEYWVIPALDIQVNLETGDFFPWPFELGRRIGDFITLYMGYSELPFRGAVAFLDRIASNIEHAPLPPLPVDGKNLAREKRRIVHAALFGTSGERESEALSALVIRRRVLAYLDAHVERYPKVREEHPEFFIHAAFARLLRRWAKQPLQGQEFFRIELRSEEAKKIRFLLQNVNPNPTENYGIY